MTDSNAAVPSEEDVARAIAHADGIELGWINETGDARYWPRYRKQAQFVLALFAPVLAAERERCAKVAEDACAEPPARFAGMELEAFHQGADAMNAAIAAAIRAQS